MFKHPLRSLTLATLFCMTASAQQQLQPMRVPSPVKDAGVYHVGTGTWTRASSAKVNFGPDILFRSDVRSGYFGVGWEGNESVDEGVLPGLNNSNSTGNPGPRDDYRVDGVEFGYCSLSAANVIWDFNFYDSYVPCDVPSAPAGCVNLAGRLIGIAVPAGGFCWSAVFDLSGGNEICVEADGGACSPGYDGGGLGLDHFGWGARWSTTDGVSTGPLLDGHDPTWTPQGEGTVYQPAFSNPCGTANASALGTEDFFAIHGGSFTPGCYWFGGYVNNNGCGATHNNPGAQLALGLYTDVTRNCAGDGECNTVFCDSNPDNLGDLTLSGCDCSAGSIVLRLSGAPFDGNAAYPIIGLGSGSASPTGVSDLCLTGSPIGRYNKDIHIIAGGGISVELLSSNTSGSNVPTIGGPLCSGNTWRLQAWMRNGMAPSRFSKGIAGTIN